MAKLALEAPVRSESHQLLRRLAVEAGFQDDDVRRLLWLLNAHPELTAHARIFKNLAEIFTSGVFLTGNSHWASEWIKDVERWRAICGWIWSERSILKRHRPLVGMFRTPATEKDHPLMGRGIERHAIAAGLWTRHYAVSEYPPPASDGIASRYFLLQSHVFAAYAECRFRLSDPDFYENYVGREEAPVAPVRTDSIGPAIREFAKPVFSGVVAQFGNALQTPAFVQSLADTVFRYSTIPEDDRQRARRYVDALQLFFHRFRRVLGGWAPPQVQRRGWGGGGFRSRRPGYIHLDEEGVFFEESAPAVDDQDLDQQFGQLAHIEQDPDSTAAAVLEQFGISPRDSMAPVLALYWPEDIGGRITELRQRMQAIAGTAQCLPFDYANLTADEISEVWSQAMRRIQSYTSAPTPSDSQKFSAVAGLMLCLSLAYGQPLEKIRTAQVRWLDENSPHLPPLGEAIELLFAGPEYDNWAKARFVGLRLPSLTPHYQTVLDPRLDDIDRDFADSFVLPDVMGLGRALMNIFSFSPPGPAHAFAIRQAMLLEATKKICAATGNERITHAKISNALPRLITTICGDPVWAWMITANQRYRDEPRTFYSRIPVALLLEKYIRGVRAICKAVGIKTRSPDPILEHVNEPKASVGARFVIDKRFLTDFVGQLTDDLSDRYLDRENPEKLRGYHHRYILYSIIFQGMATSMRAVTNPRAAYVAWLRQRLLGGPLFVALTEKSIGNDEKGRLIPISEPLAKHYEHLRVHDAQVSQEVRQKTYWETMARPFRPFVVIGESGRLGPVTPAWIAERLLEYSGYPIPPNFWRAFLRTELTTLDCSPESIDALMGHANFGESPYQLYSSFDYEAYRKEITENIVQILDMVGLRPVASRAVPFSKRSESS